MTSPHRRRKRARSLLTAGLTSVLLASAIGAAVASPAWSAPAPPPGAPAAAGSAMPCSPTVKACARLSSDEAWLSDGRGAVLLGPVRMNHGAEGEETPTGRFTVQWKNKDHVSQEAGGAPMPYSVFFDGHGRAFHGGDPARQSAGCIRLDLENARRFFDALQPNDQVEILP